MQSFFEEEYKKHEKALFLVALSYLHNTEDARDVLQEAAIAAYRSIDKLRQPEYFKTWLTRIVINKSKNFLKAKQHTEELRDDLALFCTVPTEELGFAPVLIDEFENGYSFVSGKGADNTVTEDDGSVKEEFKSAFFTYEKDGDEVWFSQDRSTGINVEKGELVSTVNGIDVYYYSYKNKIVPDDYEMSAEDIAAEERGELIFSWGSDKVQLSVVQSVEWRMGDIACCLVQLDGALSAEELVAMAEEAINAK